MAERPRPAPRTRLPQDNASALLLNMIRSLTSSTSEDQKELDRKRLEMGFAETSKQIDDLVLEHESDVNTCLESFKNVSSRILICREKVHNIRSCLLTCRQLLQCRRDDLKRLWMENAQQKHVSKILTQIESIKRLGSEVDDAICDKKFQVAANALNDADLLLNGPFSNIDGLNHLRTQLHDLSKVLIESIVFDMTDFLITRPFESHLLEIIKSLPENKVSESAECVAVMSRSLGVTYTTASISSRCAESVRALSVFDRLLPTLKKFLEGSKGVFTRLVNVSASVVCIAFDGNQKGDEKNLAQFLQLILSQFRSSHEAHCLMDAELEKEYASASYSANDKIQLSSTFWDTAQEVVVNMVEEYIAEQNATTNHVAKKPSNTVPEKLTLFKFESSACAVSTRPGQQNKQAHAMICPPSPWNITALYPQLERFCNEREETGSKPCRLRKYLDSFIINIFIDQFKCKLETLAEQALNEQDAWRVLMHYPSPKVLASCWNVYAVCEQIGKLIVAMNKYTERLSALWVLIIDEFAESAGSVYERVLNTSYEDECREKRKISAAWAVDEDISRLLKSLPNWFMVISHEASSTPSVNTPSTFLPVNESENDVCQRNERESEILIGNLGTAKQLSRDELITDVEVIRSLACMHESLKWFCASVRSLVDKLPESSRDAMRKCVVQLQRTDNSGNTKQTEESIAAAVERRLTDLDGMADTCLLIIHLELRVHCFFHLLPLARVRPSLPHDELDNEVVDFGRDMTQFHQVLSTNLPMHKMKYLFDGLGHLSASIFIHSSQNMQKLSENGKKRVCRNIFAVQQRLSQLTGRRESELERARAFFELLNHDPDQLLALILERGAAFSHLEYTYLLALAIRSHPVLSAQPGSLEQRIAQLKSILSQMKK